MKVDFARAPLSGTRKLTRAWGLVAGVLVALMITAGAPSWAAPVLIDPNFAVCNATTPGECGYDPNNIHASGSFNAFVIGGAGAGPLNPFLILVAVPDLPYPLSGIPGTSPVFTSSAAITVAAATSAQYGQTRLPTSGGYLGELNSSAPSNCMDVYCYAGLAGGEQFDEFFELHPRPGTSTSKCDAYFVFRLRIYCGCNGHVNWTQPGQYRDL